jgi:uncharacterized membrane protein AbrB (regulator of aidB expression)
MKGTDTEESIESGIPLISEQNSAWLVHAERVKSVTEWSRRMVVTLVTTVSIVLCILFYFICPRCLFGVLLFSACLCPFFNTMNLPLWLAIVLLIVSGWTFTSGLLSVSWHG